MYVGMLLMCIVVMLCALFFFFFFQAEDGIRDVAVTGVQTCALPITFERSAPGTWKSWKRSCELNPVGMPSAMKLANSVSVPLPRMMAPARRSFLAMKASFFGCDPPSATDPAVVGMSLVAMLSLRII